MKKLQKFLAAALLLAVVISAFGIFSAFAEDTETTTLVPNQTLDLDTKSTISVLNAPTVSHDNNTPDDTSDDYSGPAVTMTKVTEGGETYWLLQSHALAGTSLGSKTYLNLSGNGINPDYSFGDAATSTKQKVDFFVIDMDVATDTSFFTKFFLHTRHTSTGGTKYTYAQHGTCYPALLGDGIDSFYVDTNVSSNVSYPTVFSDNEWVNVTYVYDYRGNTPSAWTMYAYIDGYFVGSFDAAYDGNAQYGTPYQSQFIRPSVSDTAGSDFESMKIRNWTYTNFPEGWQGDLTGISTRGQYAVPLSEISELAYCLEGTNAARGPIASVQHADGTETEFNTFEELNASFLDGDVVTLNREVTTPLLVNAENVTFVNNGYTYKLVDTSGVDFSTAAFVVQDRQTRSVITSGDAAAFTTYFESKGLVNTYVVTLFEDLTWTRTNGSDGTAVGARHFTFEMNGHKLTLASAKRHFDTSKNSDGVLIFQNGSLDFAGPGDFTMLANNNAIIFDNVDLEINTLSTFIDQRHGLVRMEDCNVVVNVDADINSCKSSGTRWAAFELINSTVTKEKGEEAMLLCANYATSGRRQGGINLRIDFDGSTINWPQNIIYFEAYSNGESLYIDDEGVVTCTSATLDKNAFDIDINITDSYVRSTSGYYIVRFLLQSLKWTTKVIESNDFNGNGTTGEAITIPAANAYVADGMSIDLDINVDNSECRGYDFLRFDNLSGYSSDDVAHSINTDIVVDGASSIKADAGFVYVATAADPAHVYNVTLGEDTKLTSSSIDRKDSKQKVTSTTLGDGTAVIAHASIYGDYGYVVTSSYNTYNYKLGNLAAVPFYWNDAEGEVVNINKVVTLASSAAYTYSWNDVVDNTYTTKLNPAFKPQVNLTTNGTIALNMYIPESVYEVITMDNIAVSTEYETVYELDAVIGDTEYAKLSIKGIAPKDAETVAATVALTVKGAYEDEVVGSWDLSVVDYCAKALASDATTDAEKQYVLAILNYISAVYTVEGKTADAADALLAGAEFDAVALGTAKYDSIEGISAAALNLGSSINWVFKVDEGYEDEVFTFTYYVNGEQINVSRKADANGEISIGLRAYDALKDVVVNGSTVNLAGYAASDAASGENVQAAIAALAIYANEAAIYNNVALGND